MRFFGAALLILLGSVWADAPAFAPIGLSRDPVAVVNGHFDSRFGGDHEPSDEGCVRGEATSWLQGRLPPGTHAYRSAGPLDAIETFARDDGANLTIVHDGCETYAALIRYVFPRRMGDDDPVVQHAPDALHELWRLDADSAFNLALAGEELRRHPDLAALLASARELPVTGDGVDFLQTRILLERAGLLDEGRAGFVELRLVKGPL